MLRNIGDMRLPLLHPDLHTIVLQGIRNHRVSTKYKTIHLTKLTVYLLLNQLTIAYL